MMMSPLDYARAACDTMMRRYAAPDLPPRRRFHYHQGVFLSGVHETWKLCGEEKYFQYMKDWVDSVFDADGNILEYTHADLDDIQPGNWLENSCSCLYVAGLCKAMRTGRLSAEYADAARRGYEGEDIQIGHVCIGTGVGDYEHYCKRPIRTNDLHGVGAFLLMCTEMQQWLNVQGK